MRRMPASRAVRTAGIALAACASLVIAAWIVLAIALPPARVLELARAQLAASLRRDVRIERAGVSLLPPVRVTLSAFAVAEPGGFANGSAFETRSLVLDLDVFALLFRRVVINDLTLDHPLLHVAIRRDGSTNFDSLAAAPPSNGAPAPPPVDFVVRSFSVRSGQVIFDDLRAARRTLFGLDGRTSFALAGGSRVATEGRLTISGFERGPVWATRDDDLDRSLAKLSLSIEHRGKFDAATRRLALEKLELRLGQAAVSFAGVIDDVGPQALVRLNATGTALDLADVLRALSVADLPALHGVSGSGRMDFQLAIDGPLGAGRMPGVRGRVQVQGASILYPQARVPITALSFTLRLAPDSLSVPDLSARVADQPVRADIDVTRFADPWLRFRAAGALDLSAIGPLIAPRGTQLAGHATFDVAGAGAARNPGAMALTGRAVLADVRIASPQLPRPMEHAAGTFEFAGDRASVHGLSASAGRSSFTLEATIARPLAVLAKPDSLPPANVDFTLRSPQLDLGELLPPTPGPTLLPNARGTGNVAIAHLVRQKLDVRNVTARVTFDPYSFQVPSFTCDGYGGRISGHANFDLRNPASPGFAVTAVVDTVQADALLSAWTPAHGLMRGALSTTIDLAGAGTAPDQLKRTLTAVGLATVASGEIGPTPALTELARATGVKSFERLSFRDLHLPFEVRNGQIAMHEVSIHSNGSDWKAHGQLGFDGALDYAVSALVPAEQVAKLGAEAALASGALADPSGRIHMAFRVTGNAKNPRVTLDAAALQAEMAGKLKSAIGENGGKVEAQLRQALGAQSLTPHDSAGRAKPLDVAAVAESLKKIKGSDLLKTLFGGGKHAPPDTAKR
jgi:AsmA-like C-terminal region/Protein of unknown function/AsmA family